MVRRRIVWRGEDGLLWAIDAEMEPEMGPPPPRFLFCHDQDRTPELWAPTGQPIRRPSN